MSGSRKKVLFIGDLNVDIIMGGLASPPVVDREIACRRFDLTIGSTAAICACAYAALGGRAAFLGLAGRDAYGDFMLRGLRQFGVDTRRVQRTRTVKTGVTVNLIYHHTRSQVTFPGTIAAFDGATCSAAIFQGIHHVHLAGPYQQTKFRPHITRLLSLARQRGISTSLDSQWDADERWSGLRAWVRHLNYLFVNEGEACSITGAHSAAQACAVLARAPARSIVKAGARGAYLCLDGHARRIPGFPVRVVDTTGAGDSFDAGFLYAVLERQLPLAEAARFANAVGARSCLFTGGVAAQSSWRAVIQFMRNHHECV